MPFDIRFRLNGSDRVGFAPAGALTEVKLAAPWPDPGFIGRFRPVQQRVDQSGFEATWRVSVLNRGFAGVGTSADASRGAIEKGLRDSVFGVQLVQPVTPYRGVDRMIKYGLLTVGCAFALYLAFEMMGGGNVHVVQYGLTGASMTLFPLLLLSAGEHASFGMAYALAAGGVTLQTGLYTWWATHRARFAAGFAAAIAGLFGYLFVLLRAESWSLLGGSLALFGLLFALMYATRNLGREPKAT